MNNESKNMENNLSEYLPKSETYYQRVFEKNKDKKYFVKFNWAALIFAEFWFLHRKMYLHFVCSSLFGFLPIIFTMYIAYYLNISEISVINISLLLTNLFIGLSGNALYKQFLICRVQKQKKFPLPNWKFSVLLSVVSLLIFMIIGIIVATIVYFF